MSEPRNARLASLLGETSRPESPDVESQQGRRNPSAQLLDNGGAISPKFERVLAHIFAKYSTPGPESSSATNPQSGLLQPQESSVMTENGIDSFALETNGQLFGADAKEELISLDSVEGNLTFKGFLRLYQSQTMNDEEETWRDLSTHGFDRNLELVSSRRLVVDEDIRVPMNELRGLGMGGEQIHQS